MCHSNDRYVSDTPLPVPTVDNKWTIVLTFFSQMYRIHKYVTYPCVTGHMFTSTVSLHQLLMSGWVSYLIHIFLTFQNNHNNWIFSFYLCTLYFKTLWKEWIRLWDLLHEAFFTDNNTMILAYLCYCCKWIMYSSSSWNNDWNIIHLVVFYTFINLPCLGKAQM